MLGIELDAGARVVNKTAIASSKILTKEKVAKLDVGMDNEQALLHGLQDPITEKSGEIPEKVAWC